MKTETVSEWPAQYDAKIDTEHDHRVAEHEHEHEHEIRQHAEETLLPRNST